ncbi:hypothetical protein B0H11DRAFT_1901459 [Mycena galericulata]|nr:hypothetical protein B0H11DRAFT_1901459 [Mycena galericulata]
MVSRPRACKFKYNDRKVEPAGTVGGLRFPPSAHGIESVASSPVKKSVPHLLPVFSSVYFRYRLDLLNGMARQAAKVQDRQLSAEKLQIRDCFISEPHQFLICKPEASALYIHGLHPPISRWIPHPRWVIMTEGLLLIQ